MELRSYQRAAVDDATNFLANARTGYKRLYTSPTGTGKSVIELTLQDALPSSWIVTPRLEIVRDMLAKRGLCGPYTSQESVANAGQSAGIWTPTRARNALLRGDVSPPAYLIWDEGHHQSAETYQQLDLLTGCCPSVAFTATGFRGTPRSTADFRAIWGEPVVILSYVEAVEEGYIAFPRCEVLPLIDDDVIEVQNGEFVVSQVEEQTCDVLEYLVRHLTKYFATSWDRPTMFACPTRKIAGELTQELLRQGLTATCVTGETATKDRQRCFEQTIRCETSLVQVQVVSEGVDLPIRRLVDLHPMISPVEWLQQIGRVMRPTDVAPHYICTNRNILRHAYLLEGVLPPETVREANDAFKTPSSRAAIRVLGLEAIGRFKASDIPFADGLTGQLYHLAATQENKVVHYAALVHPLRQDVIWATTTHGINPDGTRNWGRWRKCEPPEGLQGFASRPPSEVSDKQRAWWLKDAAKWGLDKNTKITKKNFAALPILNDLRIRL